VPSHNKYIWALTLEKLCRCPLSCPCQGDFRTPKNINALLGLVLQTGQETQIRRAALTCIKCVSSDNSGTETLREQRVFPEIAKIAMKFGSGSSKDLGLTAMNMLKDVASEKPSALINHDIIRIVLSIAFDAERHKFSQSALYSDFA
jgi:hypothetical protein